MQVDWYFDFVSPFSYLQWAHQLPQLEGVEITCKPVLFAGLLKHWGQKGPAEISAKRKFTYRHVLWQARRYGVPFRLPGAHPFNPLPLLRASIALDNRWSVIDRLFAYVWRDGHLPTDAEPWQQLCEAVGITNDLMKDPPVKQALHDSGDEAIERGVFGVPTLVAGGNVFWGLDGFAFFQDYLADPGITATPAMQAADELPSGV